MKILTSIGLEVMHSQNTVNIVNILKSCIYIVIMYERMGAENLRRLVRQLITIIKPFLKLILYCNFLILCLVSVIAFYTFFRCHKYENHRLTIIRL